MIIQQLQNLQGDVIDDTPGVMHPGKRSESCCLPLRKIDDTESRRTLKTKANLSSTAKNSRQLKLLNKLKSPGMHYRNWNKMTCRAWEYVRFLRTWERRFPFFNLKFVALQLFSIESLNCTSIYQQGTSTYMLTKQRHGYIENFVFVESF